MPLRSTLWRSCPAAALPVPTRRQFYAIRCPLRGGHLLSNPRPAVASVPTGSRCKFHTRWQLNFWERVTCTPSDNLRPELFAVAVQKLEHADKVSTGVLSSA